jgi:AraC-like DNA-binding protein
MGKQQNSQVSFVRNSAFKPIEARFSRYDRRTFKKHIHDTYAIGVVEQGGNSIFYQNKTETIGEGTIVLINPGEVHACNPIAESIWAYKMFYVDIDLIREIVCEVSGKDDGLPSFTDTIVQNPFLYRALVNLYAVLLKSDDKLEKDTFVHETLARLVENHSDRYAPLQLPGKSFEPTQRAYEYLMDNISKNVSLHRLSSVSRLSAYHLLRAFRDRFGLPPHTFQVQQRINIAKRMLADGIPIVQTAFELGFSDQSHFTKKFKTFVGATPRQYQLANC